MAEFDIDERLIDNLQTVNWDDLSTPEMAAFGLQLSLLREADIHQQQVHAGLMSRVSMLISLFVVAGVLLLCGADPMSVLAAIGASQAAGVLLLLWRYRRAKASTEESSELLRAEVAKLAEAHPLK